MKFFLLSAVVALAIPSLSFSQSGATLPSAAAILATGTTPVNGTNAIQTLTFGATITSGTFRLGFLGKTTAAITWSATNATLVSNIDAALEALATIGTGGVTTAAGTIVAGVNGTVTVTMTGNNAKLEVPVMTVEDESLVGAASTLTAAITTAGVTADGRKSAKGQLLVDKGTPALYQNTSATSLNPTWVKVQSVDSELTAFLAAVPTAAVADEATADGSDAATTQALANALKTKVNDLLAKLRTAGILTP